MSNTEIEVDKLIVLMQCSDGKVRQAVLSEIEERVISDMINALHGGSIKAKIFKMVNVENPKTP